MNEVAQIVASIGFPAAAFIMAGWYIVSKDKQHKEESNGLRRAIDQLTTAVKELLDEWRKAQ